MDPMVAITTDREVYGPGDTVALVLTLRNDGAAAAVLTFATTQRYDIEIRDLSDTTLWRWSDELVFGQVLGDERIAAGDCLVFADQCPAPSHPGQYQVIGRITAMDRTYEARTRIHVL
ncbi:hypothetical protein BH24GEM1_BH24GEM1_09260 [soil metagenome]